MTAWTGHWLEGSSRHARRPRSLSVDRREGGTTSVDKLADLSVGRASASVERWSVSVRYGGKFISV